jgi:FkbM family methyltransferase
MGIDIHALNFLNYTRILCPLGNVVTIGRQGTHVHENDVRILLKIGQEYTHNPYCENLLINNMNALSVESIDTSDYEAATHILDMNKELPAHLQGKFDTVFDGGCLEHIYNIPQALKNCSLLLKPGGTAIHVLPANNWCGHGFWQVSPELFFSLYSRKNGYTDLEVFFADLADLTSWHRINPPRNGQRINFTSSTPLYVMVKATRTSEPFTHDNVQQSDYVFEWAKNQHTEHSDSEYQAEASLPQTVKARVADCISQREAKINIANRNTVLSSPQIPIFPESRNTNPTDIKAPKETSKSIAGEYIEYHFPFREEKLKMIGRQNIRSDNEIISAIFLQEMFSIQQWQQRNALDQYFNEKCSGGLKPVLIDAGGNIGAASLYFNKIYKGLKTILIEPDQENAQLSERNLKGLDVTIIEGALGKEDGVLYINDIDFGPIAYRVGETGNKAVRSHSLASVLSDLNSTEFPFILKIDIEGGEKLLFSEDTPWLDRFPLIIIELHDWMLPFTNVSKNFYRNAVKYDFDILNRGENTFLFNKRLLSN